MSAPTSIQAVQAIGITSAIFVSGFSFGTSYLALPPLYSQAASISTPVFSHVYHAGALVAAPCAIISTVASGYIAYALPQSRLLSTIAAISALAPLLWTRTVMIGGIERLNSIAVDAREQEKVSVEKVEGLLRAWTWQNYVRSALSLTAGVVGFVALFQ
jgi:hypothetical protein